MRSIRYFGNGTLKMLDIPEPQITRPDDVKIKVAYCGVCGSDLHFKRAELDFLFDKENGTPIGTRPPASSPSSGRPRPPRGSRWATR